MRELKVKRNPKPTGYPWMVVEVDSYRITAFFPDEDAATNYVTRINNQLKGK